MEGPHNQNHPEVLGQRAVEPDVPFVPPKFTISKKYVHGLLVPESEKEQGEEE